MTPKAMVQATLSHWASNHPTETKDLPKDWLLRQAQACAQLTRLEMDVLVAGGLSEAEAWAEARSLFCLAPPPKYDQSAAAP